MVNPKIVLLSKMIVLLFGGSVVAEIENVESFCLLVGGSRCWVLFFPCCVRRVLSCVCCVKIFCKYAYSIAGEHGSVRISLDETM